MGNATPYERVHLRIPVLKVPDQLNPYGTPSSSPTTLPAGVPPELMARLRIDPWALRKVDPKDRENPEVLRAVIASGHPQAMEAISVYVPPEILRRPEIYSWLKDYRDGALPKRIREIDPNWLDQMRAQPWHVESVLYSRDAPDFSQCVP